MFLYLWFVLYIPHFASNWLQVQTAAQLHCRDHVPGYKHTMNAAYNRKREQNSWMTPTVSVGWFLAPVSQATPGSGSGARPLLWNSGSGCPDRCCSLDTCWQFCSCSLLFWIIISTVVVYLCPPPVLGAHRAVSWGTALQLDLPSLPPSLKSPAVRDEC